MPKQDTLSPALSDDETPSGMPQLGEQPQRKPDITSEEVQAKRSAARLAVVEVQSDLDKAFADAYAKLEGVEHAIAARFRGTLGFIRGHVATWGKE